MKTIFVPLIGLTVVLMLCGCGSKPLHNANWYYYWEKDDVILGLDRAGSPASRWDWSVRAANRGAYGAAHGPSNGYVLTDLCITKPVVGRILVQHATEDLEFWIGARTRFGIEQAAATMAHEKQHIVNYNTRIAPGETDTDRDGLADSLEDQAPYFFIIGNRDTYSLAVAFNFRPYRRYGDDEFICRMAEIEGVNAAKLDEDWSRGGAQWRR